MDKKCKIVDCPPPEKNEHKEVKLIAIEDIEDYWSKPFKSNNISHLNTIQSEVFNVAFKSNINMLICAPTGAGKTNIAMLAILQTVKA